MFFDQSIKLNRRSLLPMRVLLPGVTPFVLAACLTARAIAQVPMPFHPLATGVEYAQNLSNTSFVVLAGHENRINSARFSTDSRYILTASGDTVRLWDRGGQLLQVLQPNAGQSSGYFKAEQVAFSPDGRLILATHSYSHDSHLWQRDGTYVATFLGSGAQFSPDGSFIVTKDRQGIDDTLSAKIWDIQGNFIAKLQHDDYVTSVELSSDSSRVLTIANGDDVARLWDRDGNLVASLQHESRVENIAFSPDSNFIATTAFRDSNVYIWDREGNALARFLAFADRGAFGFQSVAFSPDGNSVLSVTQTGVVQLWNQGGTAAIPLEGHTEDITAIAFSPDGSLILTASNDTTARLWDRSGRLISVLQHDHRISNAQFSQQGNFIVTQGIQAKTTQIWDRQGQLLATLRDGEQSWFEMSPDETQLIGWQDDTARIWDLASIIATQAQQTNALRPLETDSLSSNIQLALLEMPEAVAQAVFSPDGQTILTQGFNGRRPRLWDRQGNLIATFEGHRQSVQSTEFNADGSRVLTAGLDGTARLWDRQGNATTVFNSGQNSYVRAQFSPDGQSILASGGARKAYLLDQAGSVLAEFQGHSAAFSPDGQYLVTAVDQVAQLWDRGGNALMLFEHERRVYSPEFSPDGQYVFTASSDGIARLWNHEGDIIAEYTGHEGEVLSVEFGASDRHLLVFSYDSRNELPSASLRPAVDLWNANGDANSNSALRLGRVLDAEFSPDGEYILTVDPDNAVRLRNQAGDLLATLQHEGRVESATFSPNSSRVLTTSQDGTVRLWSYDGSILAVLQGHSNAVTQAVFSPDGRYILTSSRDNTARLWDVQAAIANN